MKAYLAFNLPEERLEFRLATHGAAAHSALWDMDQWLRAQEKYENLATPDAQIFVEQARKALRDAMNIHGVDVEDLP
jgi:hypothetical protein